MTLKQITEDNFSSLLRCMNPSFYLLGKLRSVPFVKDRISSISQQSTEEHKNNALLSVLCEVPDDIQALVMDGFISALRSDDQEHVANIFRRESNEVPMSDEHYHALTANIDQLCEFLDPENKLLAKLVSTQVISFTDDSLIRAMTGYSDKARKLIKVLTMKSDAAFGGLINALNDVGQSHVAYILTGEGNIPLKEEYRRQLLTTKRDYLVKNIESRTVGLVTALMSKGVFSEYDDQRVTGVQPDTNDDRNEFILNLVARKSQYDFFSFIWALNDTLQTHVAVSLVGANVVAKIKAVYEPGADISCKRDAEEELLNMIQANSDVLSRSIESLTNDGVSVTNVRSGSIEVTFACKSVKSLNNFRKLYDDWQVQKTLNDTFCSHFSSKGLKSLKLEIDNKEFERCNNTFTQWKSMTSKNRKALLSSERGLAENMVISDDLLDRLSLDRPRRQAIEQAATPEQQVKTLIDVVSRRPDSAFDELLNALKDTNQHEVADIITRATEEKATETPGELSFFIKRCISPVFCSGNY